jgi:YbbR domain-containing protein
VRRFLLRNLWLKLAGVVLALLLWMGVSREPVTVLAVSVPVEYLNTPGSLVPTSEFAQQVEVQLRGPESAVHEATRNLHPVIDLGDALPGERTYMLRPADISVPYGVEVVRVLPSQFKLTFERSAQREVPVRARVMGTFASGIRIAEVKASPAKVRIVGPEHRVKQVESATTDPLDATGVVDQMTFSTEAHVSDPLVQVAPNQLLKVTVMMERSEEPR